MNLYKTEAKYVEQGSGSNPKSVNYSRRDVHHSTFLKVSYIIQQCRIFFCSCITGRKRIM